MLCPSHIIILVKTKLTSHTLCQPFFFKELKWHEGTLIKGHNKKNFVTTLLIKLAVSEIISKFSKKGI